MHSLKISREALLIGAVVADVLVDLAMFGQGIESRYGQLMHGAFGRAVIMGVLGGLAILRLRQWARWTFVLLESLTAMTGLLVAFFSPATRTLRFEPGALVIFVVFRVIAGAATLGGRGLRQTPTRPCPG